MSIHISNSLNSTRLKSSSSENEKVISRVVKNLNTNKKGVSSFIASASTKNNIYLYVLDYNEDSNELVKREIFNFLSFSPKEKCLYNDVFSIDISKFSIFKLYITLFDFENEKFDLFLFNLQENTFSDEYLTVISMRKLFSSDNIFNFHLPSDDKTRGFIVSNEGIFYLDFEKEDENLSLVGGIRKIFSFDNFFKDFQTNNTNEILNDDDLYLFSNQSTSIVASALSPFDNKTFAIGLESSIFLYDSILNQTDFQSSKDQVKVIHRTGIRLITFHSLRSNILLSSGYDNSIFIWNLKSLASPVFHIDSNPHWVLSMQYHSTYQRLLLTSNSSSVVKIYVFDKEKDDNINFSYESLEYIEFDESVYSTSWSQTSQWLFGAVSYNGVFHINKVSDDVKFKVMIDK